MTLTSGTLDTHPLPLPAPPSTITPPTFLPSPLPHYPHSPRKTTWSVKMLTLLPGRRSFSSRGKTHYNMPVPARPSPCFFVLSIFIFFVNPARFPSLFTSFLCRRLYWTAGLRESLTSPPFPLTALPLSPPPSSLPSSSLGTTRPGVFRRYGELSQPRPGLCDRVDSHLQCLPREPLCCGTNGSREGQGCLRRWIFSCHLAPPRLQRTSGEVCGC